MPKVVGTVFGLNEVYALLKQSSTIGTDDYWPVKTKYGVWADGITGATTYTGSGISRFEFETESLFFNGFGGANLTFGASFRGGVSDNKQRYGWFLGGFTAPSTGDSRISRVDITGETSTVPQNGPAPQAIATCGASNNAYGYGIGGGVSVSGSASYRFDYSSETISAIPNLPDARQNLIHFGDRDYGWFTGGCGNFSPIGNKFSTTIKLDYSTDTFSTTTNHPLPALAYSTGGGTNYYGITFGGGATTALSNTVKFDYINETYSAGTDMPQARRASSANFDAIFGYLSGGSGPTVTETSFSSLYSGILRYSVEQDTWNVPGFNSAAGAGRGSVATGGVSRVPDKKFNGYLFGGYGVSGYKTSVFRHYLDVDTYVELPNTIGPPGGRGAHACAAGSLSKIYIGGGANTPAALDQIDEFDMNTECVVTNVAQLPAARFFTSAAENASSDYGYFCGGEGPSPGVYSSEVLRIDFYTFASNTTTSMPTAMCGQAPTSAPYLGKSYLIYGDTTGAYRTNVRRLEWSTETWDDTVTTPVGYYNFRAFRNNQNAWLCPGPYTPSRSLMFRWDYSTDSITSLSPLGVSKRVPVVNWSNYVGYIGGGVFDPTAVRSFDMSTETPAVATSFPTNQSDTGTGTQSNTY